MATTYLYHPTKQSAPAWTFGGKKGRSESTLSPGPGKYDPEKVKRNTSVRIGTASRESGGRFGSPGPSDYDGKDKKFMGPSFTMRPKTAGSTTSTMRNPGPGNYSPTGRNMEQRPAWSFGLKGAQSERQLQPGPGQYESRPQTASSVRIGTSKRDPRNDERVPGPGSYEFCQYDKPVNPNYRFGKMSRAASTDRLLTVGPGSYNFGSVFTPNGTAKGITMTPRRKDMRPKVGKSTPGPGNYESTVTASKQKHPEYSIGKQKRMGMSPSELALCAPGRYEVPQKTGTTVRIGTGKRDKAGHDKLNTPGPGMYDHEKNNTAPRYTFQHKSLSKLRDPVPGPGTYEQDVNDFNTRGRAPTHKIGTQKRDGKKGEHVPGPGRYECYKQTVTAPKWKFGTQKKTGKGKSATGGFTYNIPASVPIAPKYLLSDELVSAYSRG